MKAKNSTKDFYSESMKEYFMTFREEDCIHFLRVSFIEQATMEM